MGARDVAKQYAVNWNNHMNHVKQAFDNLLNNRELTDVTLYAEGKKIGAHKLLLSACSVYFQDLFREFPQEHPIVVLKGVTYTVLSDILKFIYHGEVSVDSNVFENFLQTAEYLQISGLTDGGRVKTEPNEDVEPEIIENTTRRKKMKRSNLDTICNSDPKKIKQNPIKIEYDDTVLSNRDTIEEDSEFSPSLLLEIVKEESPGPPDISTFKTDDPLQCQICMKIFSHPYSLHHHKAVHSGGTECPICHAVLSRKYNLKMHMRSRHNIIC